ncbi:carboxypeptidase regulatory-like domain-containing protein [Variovorax sp. LG9.2]|jgi:hypothetical protein|uniref:carboxypeptidase regulatory-like domain-containing protein n=1 Tax=Variovorax sp. LG9.2 TaxID=3048626 RepID=UPI002B230A58|nr:carboxypeptidase regulatory-like domain-containing protein [Variovorax sp. LG9.2]MEB0056335.1 carboxypeptidase regulatory-like domain-containing protein [Variovorax sp. LG9.2]
MTTVRPLAACPRAPARSDRSGAFAEPSHLRRLGWAVTGAAALAVSGCGGGGGGYNFPVIGATPAPSPAPSPVPAPAPAPAPATSSLTGVAATGAAFAGAHLTVVDKTGTTVCDTTTTPQGTYNCTLPATTQAPLVITARRDDQVLYSVTASTTGGTANVTPLTTIVVSRLSPVGDPSQLAAAIKSAAKVVDEASIKAGVAELLLLLKPLLDVLGDKIDPITGAFSADGTGHDRVLDSVSVSVRPDGTAANIEITLRLLPTGGTDTAPVSITFRSSDATPPTLPPITPSQLPTPGVAEAIASLLTRLTACYALPLSQRVNAPNDTAAVTGGPANVIAPACRTVFLGDDPASYLSGGSKVGRDINNAGSFAGLFRPGATGVVFDQGAIGFYRPNGDVVLKYHTIDVLGNATFDTLVARSVGGVLKLIGNQYVYSASVRPSVEDREFINSPAFDYVATGYNLFVANINDSGGNPLFAKVLVTAPDGQVYTLKPTVGNSYLGLTNSVGVLVSVTSILRLAAQYRNSATTGNPADKEASLFLGPAQLNDAQLVALRDEGVWSMEFFHVDTTKANVMQSYRTLKRAPTRGETLQLKFLALTPEARSTLVSITSVSKSLTFGAPSATVPNVFDFSIAGQPAWSVPEGSVPAINFTIFGRAPTVGGVAGARFDDGAGLASQARTAKVFCTPQSIGDPHCDTATTGVLQYAQGTSFNYMQLNSRSRDQLELFKGIAFYTYTP